VLATLNVPKMEARLYGEPPPAPVAWDGIPSKPEPRRLECRHGYPLSADCHVCDYDRRFYARAENTAALTEADTRMLLRSPDGSGWVLRVTLTAPQTREDRLRAAGWRVENGGGE
jgi:hypothetical protein